MTAQDLGAAATVVAFSIELLRPDDMLALRLEFVNFGLDASQTPPVLTKLQPQQSAAVIVEFQPQHVDEQSFNESEDGSLNVVIDGPIGSNLANISRLVFLIPDDQTSMPLTVPDLLAWTRLTPSLAPNALEAPPLAPPIPGLNPPDPLQTAIELPYRLILSPVASGGWSHATLPVTREDRTELWHTRLGVAVGEQVDDKRLPVVRAIWARDFEVDAPPHWNAREQIARLTSDFTLPDPVPLDVHRLTLSCLGGLMDGGGAWDPVPNAPELTLALWHQVIATGRDQNIRQTTRGYLCPFGHRAALFTVTERKLETAENGSRLDLLMDREIVAVCQPTRDFTTDEITRSYPYGGREMPFTRVTITTKNTSALSARLVPPDFPVSGESQSPSVFMFDVVAEDREGHSIDFSMPLMFVEDDPSMIAAYDGSAQGLRTADLRGQIVAYAASNSSGDTEQKTVSITFTALETDALSPPFLPAKESAVISLQAVDQLLATSGVSGLTQMRYHDAYLEHEFDPQANPSEIFATIIGGFSVQFPAEKAGVVAPTLALDGLSRAMGPVPKVDALASGASDYLEQLKDSLNGNLLGGITLKQVINAAVGQPVVSQIPKLITTRLPDAVETFFQWSPDVAPNTDADGNPLVGGPPAPIVTTVNESVPAKGTQLSVTSKTRAPLDGKDPSFIVDGTLSNFALSLLDIVVVTFDKLLFHVERGRKPELSVEGVHVEFVGALSFVNQLAELMPPTGFSDPPVIQVTPEGVTAGYSLGIPAVGVGAFSLENIALSAEMELPFANPVGLRIAFSERFHPFLVTLSLVGGGGFLAVVLTTNGIETIEGSLELGGNITVSLAIIEANAHVLMGFYFGIRKDAQGATTLDFTAYIRVGASVDLLGIVGVSIDIYLGLGFIPKIALPPEQRPGVLGVVSGVASVTVGVHVLFVDKSFTLTFERSFTVPARAGVPLVGTVSLPILSDPSFDEMLTIDEWQAYCEAYA
jgi:hypothetical protein